MKRIYTTLALIGAMVTGAFAQRHCDLQTITLLPAQPTDTTGFVIKCTDSVQRLLIFVNNGPDSVLAEDTILYADPRVPGQGYYYSTTGNVIAPHDTVTVFNSKIAASAISYLTLPDDQGQLQDVLAADFVSGDTYIWLDAVRLEGYAGDNANSVDTVTDNNSGQVLVTWNCSGTAIKDLKNGASLNVYPNPATSEVAFTYTLKAATTASIRVTDIAGRVVRSIDLGKQSAGDKKYSVDISGLNNGMYYIELATESTRSIAKFSKN